MPTVITLNEGHVAEASALLVSAFVEDPILVHFFPDVEKRRRAFGLLINDLMRSHLKAGTVSALSEQEKLDAVAIWAPPNPADPSDEDKARSERTVQVLKTIDEVAMNGIFTIIDGLLKFHPAEPHWHLYFVGVSSGLKRRGMGRRLLDHVHQIADANLTPCYLESPFPGTRAFYESLGYSMTGEVLDFAPAPPLWTYLRLPR